MNLRLSKYITADAIQSSFSKHLDVLGIVVVYSIAHGMMLLNRGLFWDDWVYYMLDPRNQLPVAQQAGLQIEGYLFYYLFPLNDILLFRVIVFFSYLLSALLLWGILKTVSEIDDCSRFVVVLLFAVLPMNSSRLFVINSYAALFQLFFFSAAWLAAEYLNTHRLGLRIASLLIFFLSFFYNAFLVFYLLILIYILYRESCKVRLAMRRVPSLAIKYIDFLALPLVYWAVRGLFFQPYGLYEGYNALHLRYFVRTMNYVLSFYNPFHEVAVRSWLVLSRELLSVPVFAVFAGSLVISMLLLRRRRMSKVSIRLAGFMILGGCILFMVGAFPFIAVGHVIAEPYDSVISRYELLVPFGAALIVYYALQLVFNIATRATRFSASHKFSWFRVLFVSMIIAMFVTVNLVSYLQFQRDWYKQVSLVDGMRSNEVLKAHAFFVFADHALWLNAYGRNYVFYEYTSMMKYAFGDETRFGCSIIGQPYTCETYYRNFAVWNFRDYRPDKTEYVCNISSNGIFNGETGDDAQTLRLMYMEYFEPSTFRSTVDQIVTLSCNSTSITYY